jgi:hypothetical protein
MLLFKLKKLLTFCKHIVCLLFAPIWVQWFYLKGFIQRNRLFEQGFCLCFATAECFWCAKYAHPL